MPYACDDSHALALHPYRLTEPYDSHRKRKCEPHAFPEEQPEIPINHLDGAKHGRLRLLVLFPKLCVMDPPYPSPTHTWHTTTYPSIDPRQSSLSCVGKHVVITGGGTGIGVGIAHSFAEAGAKDITLISRNVEGLRACKDAINRAYPRVMATAHTADVTDLSALRDVGRRVGWWDVLVLNAGCYPERGKLETVELSDWWRSFEVNVKGNANVIQSFLPTKRSTVSTPVVIGVSSGGICFPVHNNPQTGYNLSKMAMTKMIEYLAQENSDIHVVSMHPGRISTNMPLRAGVQSLPKDNISLPSDFCVWLASPEASFLRGKFVWCNWDVDDLKSKAYEIQNSDILTVKVAGWPFTPF